MVTAVNEKGKAFVAEETAVEPVGVAMLPGIGFYSVWGSAATSRPTSPMSFSAHLRDLS